MLTKSTKERIIESHLRHYASYRVGITNCKKQLDYIMPSLVPNYYGDTSHNVFFISNKTEAVALDRIESKRAIDLREEIERFNLIIESIDNALAQLKEQERQFIQLRYFSDLPIYEVKSEMGYREEKTIYRIRRRVLDKLLISLKNLIAL